MVAKKLSKSKLKREAKRAKQPKEEVVPETETVNTETLVESDEEEAPEAVPLNELEDEDEDEISDQNNNEKQKAPKAKPSINNEEALIRLTEQIKLKNLPWIETMSVTSSAPVDVKDVNDDMARELAFYKQALEAAKIGREKVLEAGVPFSRPDDYFAEMLKSDEHMAKVRQRLLDEDARIKAAQEARRQRELRKFGKKVQVQKQLERQKQKTETLEKIKLLKRKRKDGGDGLTTNDDFDIALENSSGNKAKKAKTEKTPKRVAKDAKYGLGGRKRNKKSNTAESSAELGNYNKMKGRSLYLGKGKKTPGKPNRK